MMFRVFAFLFTVIILGNAGIRASGAEAPTQEIQSLTLQWTGLERQQSVLRSNWRQEQPVLEQQIYLLDLEQTELSSLLNQTEQDQGQVEQRRFELLEEQTALEREQNQLESELAIAIIQVEEIHLQLPPPLKAAWDELIPKLLSEQENLSDRLAVLLEMLSQQDDFHRKITLNQTIMTMDDGNDYLVNQVYLGLSHGWLISADGNIAMSGHAASNGWQWQSSDETEQISSVIAILERQKTAELISLSLTLFETGAEQ